MWFKGWRDQIWTILDQKWDLLIIGGGITGAGIFSEATRLGLRTLLVEGSDFASGTSSRSSKLVHGGFRYLKNAQINITRQSVLERERLLKEGRGLVNKLGFLMPAYKTDRVPSWVLRLGLIFYDLLAGKWGHRYYDNIDTYDLCPFLSEVGLKGGFRFIDAQTDDARLVIRLIREGVRRGGVAINYAKVTDLLLDNSGQVRGVQVINQDSVTTLPDANIQASIVINATGAWSDELCSKLGIEPRLRKLRGSHLVFRHGLLPLSRAVSFFHPTDGRPIFAIPWEGVTVVGTTDIEHHEPLVSDPSIDIDEIKYLLDGLNFVFPTKALSIVNILSTFSGIRSVRDTGKADPSKESREHVLWCDNSLLTITGGKLTTFRIMARDTLRYACNMLPAKPKFKRSDTIFDHPQVKTSFKDHLDPSIFQRLLGRYGIDAQNLLDTAKIEELQKIEETNFLWSELRWSAKAEGIVHLDDLLLRRIRLGNLLPNGGIDHLNIIREIVQTETGWTDDQWIKEESRYRNLWWQSYGPPSTDVL